MTREEVVAFTKAAKRRVLLGEVGVSPPRQSDLDGYDRAMKDALESIPCEVYSMDELKAVAAKNRLICKCFTLESSDHSECLRHGGFLQCNDWDATTIPEGPSDGDVPFLTRDNVHTWARENGGPIEITDEMVEVGSFHLQEYIETHSSDSLVREIYAAMEAKRREGK